MVILIYGFFDPEKLPFPPCPFRTLTGWLCPGCGSQRAIHQFIHGHFMEAFKLNPLFIPAIFYTLASVMVSNLFPEKWPIIRTRYFGLTACYISLGVILIFSISRNLF